MADDCIRDRGDSRSLKEQETTNPTPTINIITWKKTKLRLLHAPYNLSLFFSTAPYSPFLSELFCRYPFWNLPCLPPQEKL